MARQGGIGCRRLAVQVHTCQEVLGLRIPAFERRPVEPVLRLARVFGNAVTFQIHLAQQLLCLDIATVGRLLPPVRSDCGVLLDSLSALVEIAKLQLRIGIALKGRFFEPLGRQLIVAGNTAFPPQVHAREEYLRAVASALGQPFDHGRFLSRCRSDPRRVKAYQHHCQQRGKISFVTHRYLH